jgi:Na+/melibiose symporter-like transporter
MKKSTIGIVLLIVGIIINAFGTMQKITHAPGADGWRTTGIIVSVIGLLVYCFALFAKKKN